MNKRTISAFLLVFSFFLFNHVSFADTLGYNLVASQGTCSGSYLSMASYAMPDVNGTSTDINIWLNAPGASHVQGALYADNAGTPGALLATSSIITANNSGWNQMTLVYPLVANTTYWLAGMTDSASNFACVYTSASGEPFATYASEQWPNWPTSFGGSVSNGFTFSMYVDYNVASDTTPPSVSLVAPASESVVSSTIILSASSTDNIAVAGVQFQIDGVNLGSEVTATSGPTIYSTTWNTTSSTDGNHIISAIAYDTSNNSSTATSSVIVHNALLSVTTSTSLGFSATSGNTATSSQSIVIKNSGTPSSTLSWSATSNQSWLTFSQNLGSLPGSATTSILFVANPTGLSAGIYDATATISDVNASNTEPFPVTFMISAAQSTSSPPGVSVGVASAYGVPSYWFTPTSTTAISLSNVSGAMSSSSPTSSFEATIALLRLQLQSLLTQVRGQNFDFTRNLSLGSSGTDVQMLQELLNQLGFTLATSDAGSPGNETQYFGPRTKIALIKFQEVNSLPATGYLGPLTRQYFNEKGLTN